MESRGRATKKLSQPRKTRMHMNLFPDFLSNMKLLLENGASNRSEEHTSELHSHSDLVCRLLLEKKKKSSRRPDTPAPDPVSGHTRDGRHAPLGWHPRAPPADEPVACHARGSDGSRLA